MEATQIMQDFLISSEEPLDEAKQFFLRTIPEKVARAGRADWHKMLCFYRDECSLTAFGFCLDFESVWWVFLLGVQSPNEPWFLRATLRPDAVPPLDDVDRAPWFLHRFVLDDCPLSGTTICPPLTRPLHWSFLRWPPALTAHSSQMLPRSLSAHGRKIGLWSTPNDNPPRGSRFEPRKRRWRACPRGP